MRVTVIGGGITGLAAAVALRRAHVSVTLLERERQLGGMVRSERAEGYLVEAGPVSLMSSIVADAFVRELGLEESQLAPLSTARQRYVVRGGRPVPVPMSPGAFLSSPLLSLAAKMRIAAEPFVGTPPHDTDESVASLVRRRFGAEILDYVADPFVGGIYAGDPERLSVRHALARLYEAERTHGSIIMSGIRSSAGNTPRPSHRMTSFADGLAEMPRAAGRLLARERVVLGARVVAIRREGDEWLVEASVDGESRCERSEAVIYAGSANDLAAIDLPAAAASELPPVLAVRHAPVATLSLGFRRADVAHPLDGFGVLVPAVERRKLLGVLFPSSVFIGRAPGGHVLLTCFLGGVRAPEMAQAPLDDALPVIRAELRDLLGVTAPPRFVRHTRWARAIPQYEVGYSHVTAAASRIESANPGLYLAGAWRNGVALGDCMAAGRAVAERTVAERGEGAAAMRS